jgi:preprotein translocase subunit YajC
MIDFLLFLLCILIFGGVFYFIIFSDASKIRKWRNDYPTLKEYYRKNPYVKTRAGIECFICKSTSASNDGVTCTNDPHRAIKCNQCSARLYRIEAYSF